MTRLGQVFAAPTRRLVLLSVTATFFTLSAAAILIQPASAVISTPGAGSTAAAVKKTPCQKAFPSKPAVCKLTALAHRGGTVTNVNTAVEDTLTAFKQTQAAGLNGSESDVWPLASNSGVEAQGIPVYNHDPTWNRTISAASLASAKLLPTTDVVNTTYAQFTKLKTKGGAPVTTLAQGITWACQTKQIQMVEIKWNFPNATQVAQELKAAKCGTNVWFYQQPDLHSNGTCTVTGIDAMQAAAKAVGIKILVGVKSPTTVCNLTNAQLAKYNFVTMHYTTVTPAIISRMHGLSLKVYASGTENAAAWKTYTGLGVNGLLTDHPQALANWLGR